MGISDLSVSFCDFTYTNFSPSKLILDDRLNNETFDILCSLKYGFWWV